MYLKKKATVLISTVLILSLMSILGCLIYKMMKNNNELGSLYKIDKDIYDLDENEEKILSEFMIELNKKIADKLSHENAENKNDDDTSIEKINMNIQDSTFKYDKAKGKLILTTKRDSEKNREREITYIFKGEKVVLIPTFKFEDKA